MKKFYFLIFGFILLVMITSVFLLVFSTKKNVYSPYLFSPTPTPIQEGIYGNSKNNENSNNPTVGLHPNPNIVSVSPLDKSLDVSLNTQIVITFDRNVNVNDFSFWIAPDATYTQSIIGKTLTVIPNPTLTPDTAYSFGFKFPDGNYSTAYTFSTIGTGVVNNPNYDNFSNTATSFDKQNNPDLFLSNQLPYSTDTFYANSAYTDSPIGHYYFVVIMLGPDNSISKNDFISWIKSIGLADNQIQKLDIRYQANKGAGPD